MEEKRKKHKINIITAILSFSVFILVWQFISFYKIVDPTFIGMPSKILKEGINLFKCGEINKYIYASLISFFLGVLLSSIVSILGGMIVASRKTLYRMIAPYIFTINSVPVILILPLIIIWFGIGFNAKLVVIFLMSFVPFFTIIVDGVRSFDDSLVKMAKSFKAKKIFILKTITFFQALPFIFSGLRVAVGRAIIALIVAEFFGLGKGLGYLASFYGATYQINRLMVIIFLIVFFNLFIVKLIDLTEKAVIKWKN